MISRARALHAILLPALMVGACLPADRTTRTDPSTGVAESPPPGTAVASSTTAEGCVGPEFDWGHAPDIVQA